MQISKYRTNKFTDSQTTSITRKNNIQKILEKLSQKTSLYELIIHRTTPI